VKVLYFAQARDAAGTRREAIRLSNPGTVEALLSEATKQHPRLATMKHSIRIAVNSELVEIGTRLQDGDEVALLPPVTGG